MADSSQSREFQGTERFVVQRRLGAGGFGTVYEVHDRERGSLVALKVLRRIDPNALYRFKHEFRTLADIVHPNLATLYELIAEGDRWFLTMELVQGVTFLEHVRGKETGRDSSTPSTSMADSEPTRWVGSGAARTRTPTQSRRASSIAEPLVAKLRAALRQLAEGVHALHRHGILHCDIKPSNVLVGGQGRVVLLDFGFATRLAGIGRTGALDIGGTPQYMSPEQAGGFSISEASDWYSVGVMLYESLTGLPPFSGSFMHVLQQKQAAEPVAPGELVPGIPPDLDALCRDLLQRDQARRLSGVDVLARLGASPSASFDALGPPTAMDAPPFVGRSSHLAALREAFETMKAGQPVAVQVHGRSGMGKTALVSRFIDAIPGAEPDAVVLTGRCYEQESVPYKALDSLIDALSQYLKQLPDTHVKPLIPRGVWALERVFAVLRGVDWLAQAPRPAQEIRDPQELRRRAFGALRELLRRIAERRPLVLFIDDLQWGDIDSAGVLAELLRPPDPPPFMFVAAYRSEDTETSPLLRRLLPLHKFAGPAAQVTDIDVAPLTMDEAGSLALSLLGRGTPPARAEAIARESGGSPLFIDQLVQYGRREKLQGTLDAMLQARVAELAPSSRQLLEVVAVAGRPLDVKIARLAADVEPTDSDAVAALRAAHFIRMRRSESSERSEVEPYHDRIREMLIASLSPAVRTAHHRRLATTFEASGQADPEVLAIHFRAAGEADKAVHYALEAAQQATDALAFERAARLYRLVLDLQPADDPRRQMWWAKSGDALANAGRVIEAARAYLAAREGATRAARLDFERLASEQFLMGGHVDEGIELLRSVLHAVGMKLPESPRRALLSLIVKRPYIRLRGMGFHERREHEIPAAELQRVDMCASAVRGLGFIDPIGAIAFQARHLLRALKVGEPYRVARALAFQATAESTRRRGRSRARRLLQMARELAERIQHPHAIGLCWSTTGLVDLMEGRWKRAWEALHRAEEIFRERCATHSYDIVVSHIHGLNAMLWGGELGEYFRLVPEFLSESRNRGDLYAETNLRLHDACRICYVEDDPVRALDEVKDAMSCWSERHLSMERATELLRLGEFQLYSGDAEAAWQLVCGRWSSFAPLLLFGIQIWVIGALFLRARTAVSKAVAAPNNPERSRLLDAARADAARIERQRTHWGEPLAQLIRAGVASATGDHERDQALRLLSAAEVGFREADMRLHAAAAARQRGFLAGGDGGRALIVDSEQWMRSQGIRNPARMSAMIAPGAWSA